MKAKSITAIEMILKRRKDAEFTGYKNIRYNLEQKYGTEWTMNDLSGPEKTMLRGQKKLCDEANELYEDFMNHEW